MYCKALLGCCFECVWGGGEGYMKVNVGGGVGFLKVNEGGANNNLSPKKMFRTMFVWLQLLGP